MHERISPAAAPPRAASRRLPSGIRCSTAGTKGRSLVDHMLVASLASFLLVMAIPAVSALDVELRVRPNPVVVGEQTTISIIFDWADATSVSADPFSLPDGLQLASGPYIRPYIDEDNPSVAKVEVSYVVAATVPGRYAVPGIIIHARDVRATTRPFVLAAGVKQGDSVVVPPSVRWRPLVSPIYVGETIPLALEIENETSPATVDKLVVQPPAGTFEPAPGLLSTSAVTVGDTTLYTIPAAVYEFTPGSSGTLVVPAASVRVGGLTGSAQPLTLTVLPDPAGIEQTGAIGAFTFRASTEKADRPGAITLRLEIAGNGNLGYLHLPDPVTTNLLTLDDQETRKIVPSLAGYSGSRERIIRYLAAGEGVASLRIPDFSWFDPQDRQLHTVRGRLFSLPAAAEAVKTPSTASARRPQTAPQNAAGSEKAQAALPAVSLPFGPDPWAVIEGASYRDLAAEPLAYLWLLPGPIFFLIVLSGRRFWRGTPVALLFCTLLLASTPPSSSKLAPVAKKALSDYEAGRLTSALAGFTRGLEIEPKNAALFYNKGLTEYRLGVDGYAVNSVRSAIFYNPTSSRYRHLLDWMIQRLAVPEQVPTVTPINPDLFFLGLTVFVNGAGAAAGFLLLKRRAGWVILLGLCAVLALGSASGLIYTVAARSVKSAVVAENRTEMKKIPVNSASHWLDLSQGMAVRIMGGSGDYDLIETGYGIKGWVRKEGLLVDGALYAAP